jgi:hypothetical protein
VVKEEDNHIMTKIMVTDDSRYTISVRGFDQDLTLYDENI